MTCTSATHPLLVGWATPTIGLTMAPGRRGVSQSGIVWERDLRADLECLRDEHRAALLVSCMEPAEMREHGISALASVARSLRLPVAHLPIRDAGVPNAPPLRAVIRRARDVLAVGGRVVVHCLGGLGRSGVVAGCLMRAEGVPLAHVFAALRRARGRWCPETPEQAAFVRAWS